MSKEHHFQSQIKWTGNLGHGTLDYKSYNRDHIISVEGKPDILASSDPAFRGDKAKYNPEDLLISSISTCHMLWYLHLCADAGIIVTEYVDQASGILIEVEGGGGKFKEVQLNPTIHVLDKNMIAMAFDLHDKAHEKCFISNSVNFPVQINPEVVVENV